MEIVILGSGTCFPSERNQSSYLLRTENEDLILDFGSGALRSLLNFNITYEDINHIFLTHNHPDHISDLIPFFHACRQTRKRDLNIFGFKGLKEFIKNVFRAILGTEPRDYKINFVEMENSVVELDNIKVFSKPVKHTKNSIGFRVEAGGKIFSYSGDSGMIENLIDLSMNADLAIIESSFPAQMRHDLHLTSAEAGIIARKANVKKLVLTHLYPICDENIIKLQAEREFGGEVIVARDLLRVNI